MKAYHLIDVVIYGFILFLLHIYNLWMIPVLGFGLMALIVWGYYSVQDK